MSKNRLWSDFFPGSTGVSWVVLVVGLVLVGLAIAQDAIESVTSILSGIGAAMFIAGFLGLINVKVLADEVAKATQQPFEEMAILTQIRGAGIEWITRNREDLIQEKLIPSIE